MPRVRKHSWLWLIQEILRKVPPAQLNEPAVFLEPYDEAEAVGDLGVFKAEEDITVGDDKEVAVPKGSYMLR